MFTTHATQVARRAALPFPRASGRPAEAPEEAPA
jgi:hypothetical protein